MAVGDIFKELKKKCQLRSLYQAKLSSTHEGEIKIFLDKQTLRQFVTGRVIQQEMLKEALQAEIKRH